MDYIDSIRKEDHLMGRTKTDYKFETEAEATNFACKAREDKCPSEDKYVLGPYFMDENEIFKKMPWANEGRSWWEVTVETYY
jgi:hypothetical protein